MFKSRLTNSISRARFAKYAWVVLVYNVAVMIWGAFVRATISGDGCGPSWPLCNGQVIPSFVKVKTAIEFAHRASTGIDGPLVLFLIGWAFVAFPKKHPVRMGASLAILFTVTEALLGMVLVKFNLVGHNQSMARAGMMALHLMNTLLLLASITLIAWWAGEQEGLSRRPRLAKQGAIGWGLALGLAGTLILAASGAITALGDTLFPNATLAQDFSPTAHILLRLRILHPLIAMSVGLYVVLISGLMIHLRPSEDVKRFARWIAGLFATEILLGAVNALLHAPIPLQLVHLYIAYLLWVSLVLLTGAAVSESVAQVELSPGSSKVEEDAIHAALGPAGWRDYMILTKPRVISLLLFTTLAAMFIAADANHHVTPFLFIAVAIGGYMAAGAANATNMVIDRDIDGLMKRTTQRPTVTRKISSRNALIFAFLMELGSFAILWGAANLLSAMLALAGLVFYVIIYTLMLKRRTLHNIVIGGAAGSFPPLVGWAAVTGNLSPLAWWLFAIIFVWTPVHFWALALLLKDDYAEAGVPMLPVVRGERITVVQIGLYAILTAVVSVIPMIQNAVGYIYFVAAILLNAALLIRCLQLYRQIDRPRASSLFHYSMLYLALLFLMLAVDRSFGPEVRGRPLKRIEASSASLISRAANEKPLNIE